MKIDARALLLGILLATPAAAQQFTYDPLGQLTAVRYDETRRIDYQLDLAGNVTNVAISAAQAETDADGDAMADAWEWVFFNSLAQPAAGDFNQDTRSNLDHYLQQTDPTALDTDGDGSSNLDERAAGTDPLDPGSELALMAARPAAGGFVLSWQSVSGKHYWIGRTAALTTGTWSRVAGPLVDSAPMNVHTDTTATGPGPWWFRIELE